MFAPSAYPTYASATPSATSQYSSYQLPSMAQMSVATVPAVPSTSNNLTMGTWSRSPPMSVLPRAGSMASLPQMSISAPLPQMSISAPLPQMSISAPINTQPLGSVAIPNYANTITASTSFSQVGTYPTSSSTLLGGSTPSVVGTAPVVARTAPYTPYATSPVRYSNRFGTPAYTTSGYSSGYGSVVEPVYGSSYVRPVQYIPNDHHEAEEVFRRMVQARDESLVHGDQQQEDKKNENDPTPDTPAPPATGVVGKIKEKVHQVEEKIADTVHAVEHKVENVVHAVHDKVSGFFGMIGGLFHKKKSGEGKGPAGDDIGKGSTVDVKQEDGSTLRGHVVEHGDDEHVIQLHTAPPGQTITMPVGCVSHVTSFAPVVGAGVEVLYMGSWYPGHVVALPLAHQDPPVYQVACHGDEEGQSTFAEEACIRPLLSPEERLVVSSHMQVVNQQKAAEKATEEAKLKVEEQNSRKAAFKAKMDNAGLAGFYPSFVNHGYDTEDELTHMHDGEMETFGMKAGHVAKFYQAFPRGSPYVLSNVYLKSTALGIAYRRTRDLKDDSHRLAAFGSVLSGTEQEDGWLKVGNLYLPMEVGGKKIVFLQGQEPSPDAQEEEEEPKKQGIVAKAEDKVKSGLHAFAHMLHFE